MDSTTTGFSLVPAGPDHSPSKLVQQASFMFTTCKETVRRITYRLSPSACASISSRRIPLAPVISLISSPAGKESGCAGSFSKTAGVARNERAAMVLMAALLENPSAVSIANDICEVQLLQNTWQLNFQQLYSCTEGPATTGVVTHNSDFNLRQRSINDLK